MGLSGTPILTGNFLILKNYSVRILGGTFFIPLSPTILHREITILNFAQIGHIALPPVCAVQWIVDVGGGFRSSIFNQSNFSIIQI